MAYLDHRDPRPLYSQIVDNYREQILSGVLHSGDRLSSVRELAAQLAINPNTIQRAYRELETGGWIVTVPNKGCFVEGIPFFAGSEEQQELLTKFDKLTAALIRAGVSRQALLQRLQQGGTDNA